MSSGQQVIKVLAIIFAVFLIVNIVGWAIAGITAFAGISMIERSTTQTSQSVEFLEVYTSKIENVKIDTAISRLMIKEGTEFKVEGSKLPSKFISKVTGTTLVVKEEGNKKLWKDDITSELTITIPKGVTLKKLTINAGIGNNTIEDITVENFNLDCGVSVMQIDNIVVLSKTEIEGGAGRCTITNSKLKNANIEAGVGEMVISADITGNSRLDCGVGRMELNLLRKGEEYKIITSTGLGRMELNGKRCSAHQTIGKGENQIKISGGVGAVEITTQ